MYSFSHRPDTAVMDEPFYAYYLKLTGKDHPGREEIIQSQPVEYEAVYDQIIANRVRPNLFVKNMAKHLRTTDWQKMKGMENVILIRDPKQLISSYAQVVPEPTMTDIGLMTQFEIFEFLKGENLQPLILDSGEVLKNPESVLTQLCKGLSIPFSEKMLSWNPGPIPEDGVWAKFWYDNVHKSSGFQKQPTSERELPVQCTELYQACLPYYDKMYAGSIKA